MERIAPPVFGLARARFSTPLRLHNGAPAWNLRRLAATKALTLASQGSKLQADIFE